MEDDYPDGYYPKANKSETLGAYVKDNSIIYWGPLTLEQLAQYKQERADTLLECQLEPKWADEYLFWGGRCEDGFVQGNAIIISIDNPAIQIEAKFDRGVMIEDGRAHLKNVKKNTLGEWQYSWIQPGAFVENQGGYHYLTGKCNGAIFSQSKSQNFSYGQMIDSKKGSFCQASCYIQGKHQPCTFSIFGDEVKDEEMGLPVPLFSEWRPTNKEEKPGNFVIYNYTEEPLTITLWDSKSREKYNTIQLKPDEGPVYFTDGQKNKLVIHGNWGIQVGKDSELVKNIDRVANWHTDNYWVFSKGEFFAHQNRIKERMYGENAVKPNEEKLISSCKYALKYQQEILDEIIKNSGELICESEVDTLYTSNGGGKYNFFKEHCINTDVKYMKDDFSRAKRQREKTLTECKKANIEIDSIQSDSLLVISAIENQYSYRVQQIESDLLRLDDNYANKRAAEKRDHEAQMEENFREFVQSAQNHGDYDVFLDSLGHDSSRRGVTAKSQAIVREYIRAQQKQKQIGQEYTKLMAQLDSASKQVVKPKSENKQLTEKERCAKDSDPKAFWDERINKCMLKLYGNNVMEIKDIGVAYTEGNSSYGKENDKQYASSSDVRKKNISDASDSLQSNTSNSSVGDSQNSNTNASSSSQSHEQLLTSSIITGEPLSSTPKIGPWSRIAHISNQPLKEPFWPVDGFKGLKAAAVCRDGGTASELNSNVTFFLRNTNNASMFAFVEFRVRGTHRSVEAVASRSIPAGETYRVTSRILANDVKCEMDNMQVEARGNKVQFDEDRGKFIDPSSWRD